MSILEDLRWLGLDWDEGPEPARPEDGASSADPGYGRRYRQSGREEVYARLAGRLLAGDAAYPCFCTPALLAEDREASLTRGETPVYTGRCRDLSPEERLRLEELRGPPSLRFRIPERADEVVVEDVVRGPVAFRRDEIGDFVIVRPDGRPTYNFAVVADDVDMAITHVIRGAGHLSNAPRQVLLYAALGVSPPVFVHVPTVFGPDRRRLSKRHGAKSVGSFRERGYHPDAVVNYLSLLSWSSPGGEEFLTRDRLIAEISLERIRSSDTVYDPEKLRWLSARHIERMPLPELLDALGPFLPPSFREWGRETLAVAVDAIRTHLATYSDVGELLRPFFQDPDSAERARRSRVLEAGGGGDVARRVHESLRAVPYWREVELERAVRAAGEALGLRPRDLFPPVRLALTGEEHGPPIAAVMEVLGRERVMAILEEVLALEGR